MSVIDLNKRITHDWNEYDINAKSHESLIFIEPKEDCFIQAGTSIDITIGDVWYSNKRHTDLKIPDKGIKIKSKSYAVFKTQQHLAMPYNVYGIVVGKGINIFNGGVVSTGKIAPGYNGKLRIGYYNASSKTVILHKNDVVGCCIFYNTESTSLSEKTSDQFDNPPALESISIWEMLFEWIGENWYNSVSLLLALSALIVAIIK